MTPTEVRIDKRSSRSLRKGSKNGAPRATRIEVPAMPTDGIFGQRRRLDDIRMQVGTEFAQPLRRIPRPGTVDHDHQ